MATVKGDNKHPNDGREFTFLSASMAALLLGIGPSLAAENLADRAGAAFADNCFSPFLTAKTARPKITPTGARLDFYDLRPFSDAEPSPVTGRAPTLGTDRRCEVAFDGAKTDEAQSWVLRGVEQERLKDRLIAVPKDFALLPTTRHAAAVQLNPDRVAVTQVGKRAGPNGTETYMSVERLIPLSEANK